MITFEEYKKQFEIFCKIDSPEKLEICKNQYKSKLLHIEAQNYFEPFEYRSGEDILARYERNLFSLLPFDKLSEGELSVLIQPSFNPESLLVIDNKEGNYTITYTALVTNYWYPFQQNNNVTEVDKIVVNTKLNREIGDKLYALVDAAISEARKPEAGGFVLDGVIYIFTRVLNGKKVSVFKHSPDEDSKTGRIINAMQFLADNITNLNTPALSSLENLIEKCRQDK